MDTSHGEADARLDGAPIPHEHRWAGADFYLEDDHPRFRLRCECGAERSIRAWERYSDPEPVADEPMTAAEG